MGDTLLPMVSLSVGLILFEGGLSLKLSKWLAKRLHRGSTTEISILAWTNQVIQARTGRWLIGTIINAIWLSFIVGSLVMTLLLSENVVDDCAPILAAEDFAYLLEQWGGCYILIGNGKGEQNRGGCMVHNPGYDFNDDVIPLGVKYWIRLAETLMPKTGAASD